MIDIQILKTEIVELLKPLDPDKVILFGSYAYGNPTEESDIDLFLIKDDLDMDSLDAYELYANRRLTELIYKHGVGFDILSAPTRFIKQRDDYFYKVDILQNGKVWYERPSS